VYGGCHIYEHNKVTSNCVDCGGGSICEHSKVNNICRVYTPLKYFGRFTTKKYEQNISTHSFIFIKQASIEYLGCDGMCIYFKEFIEKMMTEGMTWNNIHLDHI